MWLLKVDKTRLDAFECYCIRRIFCIAPSFLFRISNAEVLERASVVRFSSLIDDLQRKLYQKIQWHGPSALSKALICDDHGLPKKLV